MFSNDVEQRTFQDYLLVWVEAFLKDRKSQNVSAGTMQFYQTKLRWFVDFYEGAEVKPISRITPHSSAITSCTWSRPATILEGFMRSIAA